jgi:hypothetical protein
MQLNPLSYGLCGLRHAMYWGQLPDHKASPSLSICLIVSVVFGAIMFALASWIANAGGDLQASEG